MNRRIRSIGGCAIATQGKEDHLCSSRLQPDGIVLSEHINALQVFQRGGTWFVGKELVGQPHR